MRKKTSIIWKTSKKRLEKVVKNSSSLSEILKHFGLISKGGNYKTLKERLKYDNIDFQHIKLGQDSNKGRRFLKDKIPIKDVLIKNSTYNRGSLKKRLIKEGLLEYKCAKCGLTDNWQCEKLVLVLDHINGVPDDNRLINLRFLCPNCNSQTKTFAGRNAKTRYYCKCGREKRKHSQMCMTCRAKHRRKIKNRPPKKQLLREIRETNYSAVGRKYDVSDNTIRKWVGLK